MATSGLVSGLDKGETASTFGCSALVKNFDSFAILACFVYGLRSRSVFANWSSGISIPLIISPKGDDDFLFSDSFSSNKGG